MATLETLRNKGGIFVAVVIGVAMIAFILGDLFSSGQSILSSNSLTVGTVNGVSIEYPQFQSIFEQQLHMQQASNPQASSDEMLAARVRDQVWNEFLHNQIMQEEYARVGLALTNEELLQLVTGPEPSPIVRQLFSNPETGEFVPEQVVNFLTALDQGEGITPEQRDYWLMMEGQIATMRLSEKYNALVQKGLGVTQLEANLLAEVEGKTVSAAYIMRPYTSIPDSTIAVTESQAEAFYHQHRELYRAPERRDLSYVVFDVRPSEEDIHHTQDLIMGELQDFRQTTTPEHFVSQNGDEPYIGKWYTREELPAQIVEWAFSTTPGDVSPVVRDGDFFLAARLIARRSLPDSAHARHILFAMQQYGPERGKELADSVAEVIRHGGDFALLASQYSDDPGSKSKGGDLDWFPQGMMVKPFNDACFEGKAHEIQVVESDFGFHIIEVLGHRGESERVDVAFLKHGIAAGNVTFQAAFNQASAFAANANIARPSWISSLFGGGKDRLPQAVAQYDSLVQAQGLSKRLAQGVEANWPQISGLSNSREIIRWAYEAEAGDVSAVFELDNSYVVALLTDVREAEGDYASFEAVRNDVAQALRQERRREQLTEQIRELNSEGKSLSDLAHELGEGVQNVEGISFASFSFGQAGFEPAVVGACVGLAQGKISAPVAGNAGVFLVSAQSVNEENGDPLEIRKTKQDLLRNRSAYGIFEALRRMADVEDNRAKFF